MNPRAWRITAASSLAAYGILVAVVWPFEIDDAYISMRYARNLVRGCGLAFNCGERPFEGFTNMLLVLIEAGAMKLGLVGTWVPKAVSAVAGAGLIAAVARAAPVGSPMGLLAVWSVATSTPFVLWTAGGLETVLFTALAVGGVLALVRWRHGLSQALLVLATVARPEGALFWVVCALAALQRSRDAWRPYAGGLAALAAYAALKLTHFGTLVPATYVAKERSLSVATLAGGAAKLASFLSFNLNLAVAAAAVAGLAAAWSRWEPRLLGLLAALYASYLVTRGYSVNMDHGWRLFVPLVGLASALLAVVAAEVDRLVSARVTLALLACLVVARLQDMRVTWLFDINAGSMRNQVAARELRPALDRAHVAAGKWLAAHAPRGATVVAHSIGAIGWYSDLRVIDTWSLVTPELVAIRRRMRGGDATAEADARNWIATQRPEYLAQDAFRVLGDDSVRGEYERAAHYVFMRAGVADVFTGAPYVDSGLTVHARRDVLVSK